MQLGVKNRKRTPIIPIYWVFPSIRKLNFVRICWVLYLFLCKKLVSTLVLVDVALEPVTSAEKIVSLFRSFLFSKKKSSFCRLVIEFRFFANFFPKKALSKEKSSFLKHSLVASYIRLYTSGTLAEI